MHLDQKVSLKAHHTFGMEVEARYFVEAKTHSEVLTLLNYRNMIHMPILFLGGGSNVLFTGNFTGIVIKINSKGIEIKEENEHHVIVTAEAGEEWDQFVQYCVDRGWSGIENLSLIPGKVGAAPIQNIGAYGSEVKEVIESVRVIEIDSGKQRRLTNAECQFGYRDSIFKRALRGKVIILNVTFKLLKVDKVKDLPLLRLDYGDIRGELQRMEVSVPGIHDVRNAVCNIRRRKLPDPAVTGNAGSFFKNPVIDGKLWNTLHDRFPEMPHYPQPHGSMEESQRSMDTQDPANYDTGKALSSVKIPAAWLIEQSGWKGYRNGDAGVHPNQPLVLVNYGTATGNEILGLARQIMDSVQQKFGILLETEVNVIG